MKRTHLYKTTKKEGDDGPIVLRRHTRSANAISKSCIESAYFAVLRRQIRTRRCRIGLTCITLGLSLLVGTVAAQDKHEKQALVSSPTQVKPAAAGVANWLAPGDAALLAAAKAGYDGQKIHKPIPIGSRLSQDSVVTPIMLAGQLGAEQRKVFGPPPENSKVLEASGKFGIGIAVAIDSKGLDETADAEFALQIQNDMVRPSEKNVIGRGFDSTLLGQSWTTVNFVLEFELASPPIGHNKLLVRQSDGHEYAIEIDFDKLNQIIAKEKL